MQSLGVPYPKDFDKNALNDLYRQAEEIALRLKETGVEVESDREIIAMIAYLQRLGIDINTKQ
jgi:cytochrome c oxidase cbb3-type subunit I/II